MVSIFGQKSKAFLEMTAMDEGSQIDRSDEQPQKADSPMLDSLEPGSNATLARLWQ
jgi:hypothetical protein